TQPVKPATAASSDGPQGQATAPTPSETTLNSLNKRVEEQSEDIKSKIQQTPQTDDDSTNGGGGTQPQATGGGAQTQQQPDPDLFKQTMAQWRYKARHQFDLPTSPVGGEGGSSSSGSDSGVRLQAPTLANTDHQSDNSVMQPFYAANGTQPPALSKEEEEKARKMDRREKRMNTAKSIMDTLSRVANYAATTQGAPSAKWKLEERAPQKSYLAKLHDYYSGLASDWNTAYANAQRLQNEYDNNKWKADNTGNKNNNDALHNYNQDQMANAKLPDELAKMKAETDKLMAEGRLSDAQANRIIELLPNEIQLQLAERNLKGAQTYAYWTRGLLNTANANRTNQETESNYLYLYNGKGNKEKYTNESRWRQSVLAAARNIGIISKGNSDSVFDASALDKDQLTELAELVWAARSQNEKKGRNIDDPIGWTEVQKKNNTKYKYGQNYQNYNYQSAKVVDTGGESL
ncbi:MAG: hypothetical protein LUC33_04440, partial [Prevotellaceae bacterium]|nr:hypothetical protein [Prevotellaceae bacterium]